MITIRYCREKNGGIRVIKDPEPLENINFGNGPKYNVVILGELLFEEWKNQDFSFFGKEEARYIKYNYLKEDNSFLLKEGMDKCIDFSEGFGRIKNDDKWNYVDINGKLLLDEWIDICYNFNDGFGVIINNNKQNYVDKEGKLLLDEWIYECNFFNYGFGVIGNNNKWNYLDINGKILLDEWVDDCVCFIGDISKIKKDGSYYLIFKNGEIIKKISREEYEENNLSNYDYINFLRKYKNKQIIKNI